MGLVHPGFTLTLPSATVSGAGTSSSISIDTIPDFELAIGQTRDMSQYINDPGANRTGTSMLSVTEGLLPGGRVSYSQSTELLTMMAAGVETNVTLEVTSPTGTVVSNTFNVTVVASNILWSGDFSTGDFTQYDNLSTTENDFGTQISFFETPPYGRPPQYGNQLAGHVGDGTLMNLVRRGGALGNYEAAPWPDADWDLHCGGSDYVVRQTLKGDNDANGTPGTDGNESQDLIPGQTSSIRRTALQVQKTITPVFNALPEMVDRWVSTSVYIPSGNFARAGNFGMGNLFSFKPVNEPGGTVAAFSVALDYGAYDNSLHWVIRHNWDDGTKGTFSPPEPSYPYQFKMVYSGDAGDLGVPGVYPRTNAVTGLGDSWTDGVAHFNAATSEAVSHAALTSVLEDGWTDWVAHIHFDWRGLPSGGAGFIRVWKREGNGPWVYVLNITPGNIDRGGENFDMGIGFKDTGGYGAKPQLYCSDYKLTASPLAPTPGFIWYLANMNIANENSSFSEVSPDGSTP